MTTFKKLFEFADTGKIGGGSGGDDGDHHHVQMLKKHGYVQTDHAGECWAHPDAVKAGHGGYVIGSDSGHPSGHEDGWAYYGGDNDPSEHEYGISPTSLKADLNRRAAAFRR